ncbi:type VI secretion system baseplate subunit TssF [Caballeronia sp. GAFFF3]|uniref:type VI secretion system baseplate subunit TssF n=1 Tax=Caballeronia sp. GAFFF3 TaxID=2921759 RepID=UPI0020288510|nr:type VI secretion system baseplate subunit TssF [Caballeronia sp. GAFFF3]
MNALDSQISKRTDSGFLKIWGFTLAAMLVAVASAAVAWWGRPDFTHLTTLEMRVSALLEILGVLIIVLGAHFAAILFGLYDKAMARLDGLSSEKQSATIQRDARLQYLRDELRTSFGWRWRRAIPWLMLTGDDALIDAVAPDLKQTAVLRTGEIVLVHAAPNGIDAQTWRHQLRRMCRAHPIDAVIPVLRTSEQSPSDDELPRTLSNLARDLGWAAPVVFLHAVEASGMHQNDFRPVGAFIIASQRADARVATDELNRQLNVLEEMTAHASIMLCARPKPIVWLAQVSQYLTAHRERVLTTWRAHSISKWRRAPLAGMMFAPVFAGPVVPTPVPADHDDVAKDAAERARQHAGASREQPRALQSIWPEIVAHMKKHDGRRVGFYWPNALAALVLVTAIGWCVTMSVSFIGNRSIMNDAQSASDAALAAKPGTAAALRAQLALQQRIDALEYRQQHGAPWYLRAGLNHNDDSRDSFRLFCTPVINLFEVDALPLRPTDRHDREHRVRLQQDVAGHVEPYHVLAVTAADPEDSARHAYGAFTSFRHRGWTLRYEKPERYFHTSMRFGVTGRELWVTLSGSLWERFHADARHDENCPKPDGYLTVRALANNGRLPRMALSEATINETVSGFTGIASVRNLTAPTLPLYPPRYHPEYDWRVLGHYTAGGANELNMIGMGGVVVLREALELYDWSHDESIARRIDAIRDVRLSEHESVGKGPMRFEIRVHVRLDASAFDGPGDATLFGDVLSRFVGRYASFHHATRLVLNIDGKDTLFPLMEFEGAPF